MKQYLVLLSLLGGCSFLVDQNIPLFCGDGRLLNGSEECDNGVDNSDKTPNACRTDCRLPTCGDGVTDSGEQCDDANQNNNDSCKGNCTFTASCGNEIIEPGEQCDDGTTNANIADTCRTNCLLPFCGDGILDSNEQCDDNNPTSGDGCSELCTLELARCGNGVLDVGEQCDDGNQVDNDGCNSSCFIENLVLLCTPNLIVEQGEQCDDGNFTDGDGCSSSCLIELNACNGTNMVVMNGNSFSGDSNTGQSSFEGVCINDAGQNSDEQVLQFIPDTTGTFTFRATTNDPGNNIVLYLLNHCLDSLSREECVDEFGLGEAEQLTIFAEAGVPVLIVVDSFGDDDGPFTLIIN